MRIDKDSKLGRLILWSSDPEVSGFLFQLLIICAAIQVVLGIVMERR